MKLSREKINYLSKVLLDELFENDQVEFLEEPNEIRLVILKCIEEELILYETLDRKAIKKIESQKKTIKEGTREWEILYRKYYNDEISKLGKIYD